MAEIFDVAEYKVWNEDLQKLSDEEAINHYQREGQYTGRAIDKTSFEKKKLGDFSNPQISLPDAPYRAKVAVLAHLYYFDQWPKLWQKIQNLKDQRYDLYVNFVESTWEPHMTEAVRQDCPDSHILVSRNSGRDIGGYVKLSSIVDFASYDAVIFIHTKKSPHIHPKKAALWFEHLTNAFLESPEKANQAIDILMHNPHIGAIASAYWRDTGLADNQEKFDDLLQLFQISDENRQCEYISGTICLYKASIVDTFCQTLKKLLFEDGDGTSLAFHQDGQYAHAAERVIGNLLRQQGFSYYWQR